MIPEEKLKNLVQQLISRSQRNEVRWIGEGEHIDRGWRWNWFQVRFPNAVVRIGLVSPPTDPDYFTLRVENAENSTLLGSVRAVADGDDPTGWDQLLRAAYGEAERFVTGWDRALAELEAAVTTSGPVGLEPSPAHHNDDVPF